MQNRTSFSEIYQIFLFFNSPSVWLCPTDVAPVIANNRARMIKPFLMQWGFSGFKSDARPVINTRSETALEKNMFREPLLERRCLIPASHYFEWHAQGRSKIKHAIKTVEPMIYMAGIYRFEPNRSLPVFSILTKKATPDIQHMDCYNRSRHKKQTQS